MHRKNFHRSPMFLIAVALLGTFSIPDLSRAQGPPDGAALKAAEPVLCSGNRDVVLRGRSIETGGNGIVVHGNCDVEIVDSRIVAGGVAVLVQGNGEAVINRSWIEGGLAALVAEGRGEIRYRETTLRGATRVGGHGEIQGDDGAVHSSVSSTVGDLSDLLGKVRVGREGLRVEDGSSTVTIGSDGVVVDDGRETVRVKASPEGLRVEAGDVAVVLDADVRIDGDLLRLAVGGSLEISDGWRDAGSSYVSADTDRLLVELGVREEDGELHLGLAGDVLFDVDSTFIRTAGAAELRKVAHVLRQRAAGEVRLVGHTDSLGKDEHNLKLSQARAVAVMRWLNREEGIPTQIMVGQGMGSKKPVAYNTLPDGTDNPEGRAQNRRVEIYFATSAENS